MKTNRIALLGLAIGVLPAASHGGELDSSLIPMMPAGDAGGVAGSAVSGTLSLDYNSHFISYGFDVWGGGDTFDNPTFNPSLELNWAMGDFTLILGTWWDMNDEIDSSIGGRLQEVDVWVGGNYTFGDWTIGALYQAWMYGSSTEEIVDVSIAYDTILSPSLTIHNRIDEGASGGNTGTIAVLGLEHGFDVGPVSVSIPFNVAYFFQDDFHPGSTDDGIGYYSIGVTASVPMNFVPSEFGEWDIHASLIYYITDEDVVANAVDDDFLTGGIGISCAF